MASPTRQSTFNPPAAYEHVYVIGGRNAQDWAINELQRIRDYDRRRVNDALFRQLAVLSGLAATPDSGAGSVAFTNGVVYVLGRAMNVAAATVTGYPTSPGVGEIDIVYLEWLASQFGLTQDATLADPYTGDPVEERIQMLASLASSNPDVLDESFEVFQGGLPYNSPLGVAWTVAFGSAGSFTVGDPPHGYQLQALQIASLLGTPQALQIVIPVVANTAYTLSMWVKTVYGKPDIATLGSAYAYISVSNTTGGVTLTTPFTTSGGATLLGGYQQVSFSFTTGSGTSSTITLGTGASAPTTQFLVDDLLITKTALASNQLERHYYPLFNWARTPNTVSIIATPKTVLSLNDLSGEIDAKNVTFEPDVGTAPDITTGTAQSAIDQLSTSRALLAGSATQTFSVANATTDAEAPSALQIQRGALLWGGTSTNSGNAYAISLSPALTSYVAGMTIRFIANAANTSASTVAINGLTALTITRPDGTSVQSGDIRAGAVIEVVLASSSSCMLSTPPAQYAIQSGATNYAADTGTANAYVVTLSPVPIAFPVGFRVSFLALNTSTGASTLNVNGSGANPLVLPNGGPTLYGDVTANYITVAEWTGSAWQIVSKTANANALAINGSGVNGVTLASNYTLTTAMTTYLSSGTITVPPGGPWRYLVTMGARVIPWLWSEIINGSFTGTSASVTIQITDGTVTGPMSAFTSATVQTNAYPVRKEYYVSNLWISPSYVGNSSVTFNLQALETTSNVTGPGWIAGESVTHMRWVAITGN